MATQRENELFTEKIMVNYPLDEGIGWIKSNLNPEDVFDEGQLEMWASTNGYIKEE